MNQVLDHCSDYFGPSRRCDTQRTFREINQSRRKGNQTESRKKSAKRTADTAEEEKNQPGPGVACTPDSEHDMVREQRQQGPPPYLERPGGSWRWSRWRCRSWPGCSRRTCCRCPPCRTLRGWTPSQAWGCRSPECLVGWKRAGWVDGGGVGRKDGVRTRGRGREVGKEKRGDWLDSRLQVTAREVIYCSFCLAIVN